MLITKEMKDYLRGEYFFMHQTEYIEHGNYWDNLLDKYSNLATSEIYQNFYFYPEDKRLCTDLKCIAYRIARQKYLTMKIINIIIIQYAGLYRGRRIDQRDREIAKIRLIVNMIITDIERRFNIKVK